MIENNRIQSSEQKVYAIPDNIELAKALQQFNASTSYTIYGKADKAVEVVKTASVNIKTVFKTDPTLKSLKIKGIGDGTKMKLISLLKIGEEKSISAQNTVLDTDNTRKIGKRVDKESFTE